MKRSEISIIWEIDQGEDVYDPDRLVLSSSMLMIWYRLGTLYKIGKIRSYHGKATKDCIA